MKKILIIIMIICNIISFVGCGESRISNQESNSNATEIKQANTSEAKQGNSNDKDSINEINNTQNNNSNNRNEDINKKTNNNSSKKEYYTKMLNDIQSKIDKEIKDENLLTTKDMRDANDKKYKLWDDALNKIYNDLKTTLSPSDMEKLKQEELAWIDKKESDAKNEAKEVEGGTLYPVVYSGSLIRSTKNRCYELVTNYVN